ncbi:MAG: c-type cytochrome [Rubrivivax sp.]
MFKTPALLFALAACLPAAHAQDAEAGRRKVASCIGCHGIVGYQASFPEVHKVPMIAGQGAKYIVAALTAYQKGERKHPTMRAIAGSMSEQDMADVAAYYEQLGQGGAALVEVAVREPSAEVAALLTKGACASCHGANFAKPIDPSYPKIAGQLPDYLYVALKAYQTTGNPQVGRSNAIMGGIAKPFTHAELKAMAGYLGSLPGPLKTVPESKFR